jgi:hypothetical protein
MICGKSVWRLVIDIGGVMLISQEDPCVMCSNEDLSV